ncbi:hypothetical protein V6R86_09445 [Sphingomonas kaistensis]|uniref:Uncharacterized protein n=1 Tax=Sphingomonas kaistensis TaxID=298708 RepID=A0ABZ2G4T3_9SPHN
MAKQIDLEGIEAARVMGALSPETQRRFDKATWRLTGHPNDVAHTAFTAIGVAVGSSRQPVSTSDKKKLFAFAEQLIRDGSHDLAFSVASAFLGTVWQAAQNGGLDFSDVDAFLGPESRRYLTWLDDVEGTRTSGFRRA